MITIPAYFPNSAGTPVAFFAVTSISVIGLYIAYTIPVFLRWRPGDKFEPGPWTLGNKYKWVNLIAIVWVGALRDHLLPAVTRRSACPATLASAERRQLRAASS